MPQAELAVNGTYAPKMPVKRGAGAPGESAKLYSRAGLVSSEDLVHLSGYLPLVRNSLPQLLICSLRQFG